MTGGQNAIEDWAIIIGGGSHTHMSKGLASRASLGTLGLALTPGEASVPIPESVKMALRRQMQDHMDCRDVRYATQAQMRRSLAGRKSSRAALVADSDSLATSESYQNAQGERINETQWHQVVAWGKLAEIAARYLSKGREVMVAGKLTYRQYQDPRGQTRSKTEIHAHSLLLLGPQPKQVKPQSKQS